MDSLPSIEAIGASVEEAIGRGLEALNATRDQVQIAVLEEGDGAKVKSRVRVTLMAETEKPEPPEAPAIVPQADPESIAAAEEVLQKLLQFMQVDADVETTQAEAQDERDMRNGPPFVLNINGDDLGVLIGRRGETLNDLQFITRLITSKQIGQRTNLIVDVEGYKTRREQTLRRLATRLAKQVVNTRKRMILEPMPANERRIIHLTLRDHPDVTTESVGQGDNRKVTLIPR